MIKNLVAALATFDQPADTNVFTRLRRLNGRIGQLAAAGDRRVDSLRALFCEADAAWQNGNTAEAARLLTLGLAAAK